ncbi:DUF3352 domain-containing protein [Leptolyngbya ohadii]|uniref:DUF3352 domain-containing protein n=1 Tax=Leptolyngbya ohadii TaxID=1962290 RepID=UPI000B59CE8C|nr:DUF3352 domain-containing protein [Leptolyngbya ohadii]
MKLRPFLTVLTAIVLVLISASVAGAVWLSRQSPVGLDDKRISSPPEAALFVSRQAPLMLSLQINPDRLKAYRLTNVPIGERAQIQAQFDRWQRRLLGESKLSYGDDIAPWAADEMTLALMNPDVDRDPANGQQPGYLLAVEVADPTQAQASLQRFWRSQTSARNQVKEMFAGVELTYANNDSRRSSGTEIESPSLTTAIVSDRFVLFANYPKVLKQALNNVQVAELGLNADRTYQQAVEQLSDRRIGMAFVNLPQFATWLTAERPEPIDSRLIAALQPTTEGILAKLTLLSPPNSLNRSLIDSSSDSRDRAKDVSQDRSTAVQTILKNLPANSVFALSGVDVGQTWKEVQAADVSWAVPLRETVDRLQQQWDIDLAADLFPWMPGAFTLALVPRSDASGTIANETGLLQQFDAVFVTERSPDAEAGLDQLNRIAVRRGFSSGTFQLDDSNVFAWTKLEPQRSSNKLSLAATIKGLHSQVGEYQVFATSVEAMQQVIAASTAEAPPFVQQLLARLNQSEDESDASAPGLGNDRYQGYVDWTVFRSRYGNQPLVQRLEQTVKPLFEGLQTVAFTAEASKTQREQNQAGRSLGTLLLRFQEQK